MSSITRSTDDVRRIYSDLASKWKLYGIPNSLLGINRLRSLFGEATGDVLDVACGTGENFKHLANADSVIAFDLSPQMVAEAKNRGSGFEVVVGDAEDLAYPDDSFDTVVSAMSSCTFPDYVAAFQEMERVTKPGGRIMLLEHGRSSIAFIARRQDRKWFDKTLQSFACRSNRELGSDLAEAGLSATSHVRSHFGMIHRVVIEVN